MDLHFTFLISEPLVPVFEGIPNIFALLLEIVR